MRTEKKVNAVSDSPSESCDLHHLCSGCLGTNRDPRERSKTLTSGGGTLSVPPQKFRPFILRPSLTFSELMPTEFLPQRRVAAVSRLRGSQHTRSGAGVPYSGGGGVPKSASTHVHKWVLADFSAVSVSSTHRTISHDEGMRTDIVVTTHHCT
jgi:hypothetical protein